MENRQVPINKRYHKSWNFNWGSKETPNIVEYDDHHFTHNKNVRSLQPNGLDPEGFTLKGTVYTPYGVVEVSEGELFETEVTMFIMILDNSAFIRRYPRRFSMQRCVILAGKFAAYEYKWHNKWKGQT